MVQSIISVYTLCITYQILFRSEIQIFLFHLFLHQISQFTPSRSRALGSEIFIVNFYFWSSLNLFNSLKFSNFLNLSKTCAHPFKFFKNFISKTRLKLFELVQNCPNLSIIVPSYAFLFSVKFDNIFYCYLDLQCTYTKFTFI